MFMLRNVGKLIFGDTSKETLVELPQGQLYLVRPLSPKGYSELIFRDAAARIRRTGQEFQYQLVIQRAYEEGEEELLDGEAADDDDGIAALTGDRDEKTFLLDESLHFRSEIREGGEKVLAWRDLSGDAGDLYEFVCGVSIENSQVQSFELTSVHCQFERKFRRNYLTATEEELSQFAFEEEEPIPHASPPISPTTTLSPVQSFPAIDQAVTRSTANSPLKRDMSPVTRGSRAPPRSPSPVDEGPTKAPVVAQHPEAISVLAEETAELHLFDFISGSFLKQDAEVTATVTEVGKWQYWLQITGKEKDWLGHAVIADINPVFNFEYQSFIFNAYTPDNQAYSWLLRFKDQETITRFQEGLMQALWEQLNEIKWNKSKEDERDYVLEAFQDLTMEDAPDIVEGEEEEEEEEEEEVEDEDDGQKSEHYDSDEEEDDVATKDDDGNVNSQLAVGYKHDRSFVVRGSKIGVFKHTPNNHLEFSTNISKVQTPDGKLFSPKKVMLHAEDTSMILQDERNPHSLFKMDLEYGKIVDEWKVHDDIPVNTFAPESKFSQMTGEQTFLGLSRNALYRIDPRLSGNKLVDSELKQYVSKNDFSAAATTEKGYIAVASTKGDIRMFDRLGINAKTHIPALGEPIIGLDVSADGRWVLATCRTYILLIDALQKDGKNEGKLGFEKSFGKDSKPQPRRLALTPSHVAQFQHETGAPLSFTTARFNTGEGISETSIISATGPFIVTWNLKKILRNSKDPYSIKRYAEEVKADNFKYGSDKNVIVALPNEVNMVAKQSFKKPTRESIATPMKVGWSNGRRESARIGSKASGRYKLGRDDVVNSPY
ncbi:Vacuolar import and degradation protein 27 [Ciborinia camelliae]|nr:Vacuolar import and degradation protein 27 [Ciborinia camelliae]